jgi:hypothetical protein
MFRMKSLLTILLLMFPLSAWAQVNSSLGYSGMTGNDLLPKCQAALNQADGKMDAKTGFKFSHYPTNQAMMPEVSLNKHFVLRHCAPLAPTVAVLATFISQQKLDSCGHAADDTGDLPHW